MKYDLEELKKAVENADSYRGVCRNLKLHEKGNTFNSVKSNIKKHNISTEHFLSKSEHLKKNTKTYPLDDILVENSMYMNIERLKIRIVNENKLKYECDICKNIGVWNNKSITLQLDHINGVRNDHRITNLRFLCPNCHSQTDTYSGRNIKHL
jgi:5-methylcytosine-specific restriction endonuclease McrA